jgi:hypothetical protein
MSTCHPFQSLVAKVAAKEELAWINRIYPISPLRSLRD